MRKIYSCLPGIDGIVDLGYVDEPEENKDQDQMEELERPF